MTPAERHPFHGRPAASATPPPVVTTLLPTFAKEPMVTVATVLRLLRG